MARLSVWLFSFLVLLAQLLMASAASAGDNIGSGTLSIGPGASLQYGSWNLTTRKMRITNYASTTMSKDRCHDMFLDWQEASNEHYDGRVVRVCLPGGSEETDKAGDGFWLEPANWSNRSINGIRVAAAYAIDDDTLDVVSGSRADLPDSDDGGRLWAGGNAGVPRGDGTSYHARIRTLYQSGNTSSWNPTPERCYQALGTMQCAIS